MRPLRLLITIPFAAAVIVFAVVNRGPVTLDLWPLPFVLGAPVYLVAIGTLAVGFLCGAAYAWLSGHRARADANQRGKRIVQLEQEAARWRDRAEAAETRLAKADTVGATAISAADRASPYPMLPSGLATAAASDLPGPTLVGVGSLPPRR